MEEERPASRQGRIDFDRASKLSLLEHVELPQPPIGARTSRQSMGHALKAIDSLARGSDSFTARVATVAKIMKVGRSTAQRALLACEQLGVLIIDRNCFASGKRASTYRICWSNLKDFDTRNAAGTRSAGCVTVTHPMGHRDPSDESPCAIGCVTVTHPIGHGDSSSIPSSSLPSSSLAQVNLSSSSFPSAPTETIDGANETEETTGDAKAIAEKIADVVPILRHDANRSLVIKVGWLCARGEIPRAAVEDAIEAVRVNRPENRGAYFHTCVDNAIGGILNGLLSKVRT